MQNMTTNKQSKNDEFKRKFLNCHNENDELVKEAITDIQKSGLSFQTLSQYNINLLYPTETELEQKLGITKVGKTKLVDCKLIHFPYFKYDKNDKQSYDFSRVKLIPTIGSLKYIHPKGKPPKPYILPPVRAIRKMPDVPIVLTEGEKKALKLIQHNQMAITFSGVWNFSDREVCLHTSEIKTTKELWNELKEDFVWDGRKVYLAFDMDLHIKEQVLMALYELAFRLLKLGSDIYIMVWKQQYKGIDDYLATISDRDVEYEIKNLRDNAVPLFEFIKLTHKKAVVRAIAVSLDGKEGIDIKEIAKIFKTTETKLVKTIREKRTDFQRNQLKNKKRNEIFNDIQTPFGFYIDKYAELFSVEYEEDAYGNISEKHAKIANFISRIEKEAVIDDGLEVKRIFIIEGATRDYSNVKSIIENIEPDNKNKTESPIELKKLNTIEIPTSKFSKMEWVCELWGNNAILEIGAKSKENVRLFIQEISKKRPEIHYYAHTGWRNEGNTWFYLTGNGVIGKELVNVKLPSEIMRYALPPIPKNESEAIQSSLSFLELTDLFITLPLWLYAYLSPLTTIIEPIPNFSMYLLGSTGTFKSTLATCLLCHFGDFNINRLSNFGDTANSLEKRAFTLKDTLMVLDDLHPSHDDKEANKKQNVAQSIIRAFSNRTGRGRLNPDASEKGRYSPRGMLLITGEEFVGVQSTIARILTLELKRGSINTEKLTILQDKQWLLPHAMSSYVNWLLPKISDVQREFTESFKKFRYKFYIPDVANPKISEQPAYLMATLQIVNKWLIEKGIRTEDEVQNELIKSEKLFRDIVNQQNEIVKSENPIDKFKEILQTLFLQGKIYLQHKDYKDNDDKYYPSDIKDNIAISNQVGWFDSDNFYFNPTALWNEIQKFYSIEKTHFPVSQKSLLSMLHEKGWVSKKDKGQNTATIRIYGNVYRVLVIIRDFINDR